MAEFDANDVTKVTASIEGTTYTITCWAGDKKLAERVMAPRKGLNGTSWRQVETTGEDLPDIEDCDSQEVAGDLDDLDSAVFGLATTLSGYSGEDDVGDDEDEEDEEGEDDEDEGEKEGG